MLRDPNPGVRLKALEALHSLGADPAVQAAMLGALSEDGNSGVRIEALGGRIHLVGLVRAEKESEDYFMTPFFLLCIRTAHRYTS